jgi:hypothetical protein
MVLFYYTVSISDYTSHDNMINEQWNGKDSVGSGRGLI